MRWFGKKGTIPIVKSTDPSQQKTVRELNEMDRVDWFREELRSCEDARFKEMRFPENHTCTLVYIEGIIDQLFLQQFVMTAITGFGEVSNSGDWLSHVKRQLTSKGSMDINKALDAVLEGSVVLVFDQEPELLIIPINKIEKRKVGEAKDEPVVRGPKEAFVEDLRTNMGLIRKRIKHPDFKAEELSFGTYTKTSVTIVYIKGLCKPELVKELKRRLSRIEIDGVLGSSYLEEYIEENPFSPFPQVQYTERPDTLAAALLEGRIAILVDGTPMPLIVPVTLYMLLQSAEDYYQRFVAATWIRWIRYMFLLVAFFLPSTYIAITTFHPEMLPPNLLVTVAASREAVPFPAIVEALLMEISFEAIREAGLRIPKPLGQTVSIIGALIIGQAGIQAGIVSAPMLIVVSITGIASFLIPHYDLALSIRLLRFPVMMLAASLGLFGIITGVFLIYIHLVSLRSFGTSYLNPTAPLHLSDLKDVFVRVPWWMMKKRPTLFLTENQQRLKNTRNSQTSDEIEW